MAIEDQSGAYPIRAVARVCDILDVLQENPDGVILTKVASQTGMPKSSAFRYLAALEDRQYVGRDDQTGMYQLGLAFRPLATRNLDQLIEAGRPELEKLRSFSGETANLGILSGGKILHIDVLESPNIMRLAARVGDTGSLHLTALGKAIAATMAESRVRTILRKEGMPMQGTRTITNPDEFIDHLQVVREQGYGVDDCEAQEDGRCVAVVIPRIDVQAAVSISAPAARLPVEEVPAVGARLEAAARAISKSYLKLSGQ